MALRGPVLPGGSLRPAASTSTSVFERKDVVELARETYRGIGIDTAAILDRSDLYPRDGKCQHAFCIDVDREGDVRVLANVEHDRYWADTMLHELGHGAYDLGFDPSLPWLLRDCHLTMTEGIAILMGRLAWDADWLRDVAGSAQTRQPALEARLRAVQAAELLVFTRWVLVMTNFERAFYADPEADLAATWWELVARYQLLTPPDRGDAAGLGGEDPRRLRARLLPHVPVREPRRVAAPRDARSRRRRARRPPGGRGVPCREGLRAGRVGPLGPAARAGDRRAADCGARRADDRAWPGGRLGRRVPMPAAVGLNHVSIVARDLAESTRFYVDVLGLEPVPTPDFGFPVQWLEAGGQQVHLFVRPDEPPAAAHLALEVDDIVAVYERARELGILDRRRFGYAIAELPGGEAQLYVRDPAGNLVELDHPDGAAARERIDEMILLSERRPQPEGATPRLSLRGTATTR